MEDTKNTDNKEKKSPEKLTDEELSGISGGDIGYLGIARRDDELPQRK